MVKNPKIGVVGDDITGCNDIATMYVEGGLAANVFSFSHRKEAAEHPSDVVILDTDSRLTDGETAYQRVFAATRELMGMHAQRYFKKTCSVFRGNVGAELDAMMDAAGEEFAVIVLGFPDNGRTTVDGIHYVRGVRLEESEFRNDPMNPMTQSRVRDILAGQTRRSVDELYWPVLDQGAEALKAAIAEKRKSCSCLILDVRNNRDLEVIAEATYDIRVICGASAIAKYQAMRMQSDHQENKELPEYHEELGIFSVSASLMPQTREQIICALEQGTDGIRLDVVRLLEDARKLEKDLTEQSCANIRAGQNVLIYSDNDPEILRKSTEAAEKAGISRVQMGKLISEFLARISRNVLEQTGQNRILVAGGDTSASFCAEMGITGMEIYDRIESGIPSSISFSRPPLFVVLKSGSFGSREFFVKAYKHLQQH